MILRGQSSLQQFDRNKQEKKKDLVTDGEPTEKTQKSVTEFNVEYVHCPLLTVGLSVGLYYIVPILHCTYTIRLYWKAFIYIHLFELNVWYVAVQIMVTKRQIKVIKVIKIVDEKYTGHTNRYTVTTIIHRETW